jgi:hypothetical protein
MVTLDIMCLNVSLEKIYSAEETGLFWKALPLEILMPQNENLFWGKNLVRSMKASV